MSSGMGDSGLRGQSSSLSPNTYDTPNDRDAGQLRKATGQDTVHVRLVPVLRPVGVNTVDLTAACRAAGAASGVVTRGHLSLLAAGPTNDRQAPGYHVSDDGVVSAAAVFVESLHVALGVGDVGTGAVSTHGCFGPRTYKLHEHRAAHVWPRPLIRAAPGHRSGLRGDPDGGSMENLPAPPRLLNPSAPVLPRRPHLRTVFRIDPARNARGEGVRACL